MADEPLFPNLSGTPPNVSNTSPDLVGMPATGALTETEILVPDLFQDAPVNTTSTDGGLGMVDSVVSTENAKGQKFLGPKPKLSSAFNPGANQFNLGGLLFKISLLLGVLVYGFFYTQFNDSFSAFSKNPTQTLASFEASFQTEQTDINFYNMLMAKFALDDFMSAADTFSLKWSQYQFEYTANNVREDLVRDLGGLQEKMKTSLADAQKRVSVPFYPKFLATAGGYSIPDLELEYGLLLKQKILNEKKTLDLNADDQTPIEKSNLESAQALANDQAFRRELQALNLEEQLTPEKVEELFNKATKINKNLYATILTIKDSRVNWPNVINELERVTKKVDPLYGTAIQSNIDYSNLTVNASDRTISIRGETRTDDTRNFSLLSNLIDELEKSPLFSEISNRSFSKSGEKTNNFTSSFSLTFSLQTGDDPRDAKSNVADIVTVPFPTLPTLYTSPQATTEATVEATTESTTETTDSMPVFPEFSSEELEATFSELEGPQFEAAEQEEAPVEPASEPQAFSSMNVLSNLFADLFDGSDYFQATLIEANPRVPRNPRNQ